MEKLLSLFERVIVMVLILMMMFVILVGTFELGVLIVQRFLTPPLYQFNLEQLLELFGFFLLIVIGLELLETIKAYLDHRTIHVEVVFLVAMVAVARKVIIIDYKTLTPDTLLAIAAVTISLAVSYFLIKTILERSRSRQPTEQGEKSEKES